MTAGQWEQYVEQAAVPLDPNAFDQTDPQHDHWALDFRRGIARDRARQMLAVVGPRIAEDTRDRLIAAAGEAVERQPAVSVTGSTDPFASLADTLAFSSNDWSAASDSAWLYGIVLGWDSDDPTEESAMPSLAEKHEWSDQRVARLRALHRDFKTAAAAYRCDAPEAAS